MNTKSERCDLFDMDKFDKIFEKFMTMKMLVQTFAICE